MRFEQNGMVLWYGTPDAPAPRDLVRAGVSGRAIGLTVTIGVQPIEARNAVLVRYRVNGGAKTTAQAWLARTDLRAKAQYFEARLPEFNVGDTVEYGAECNCAGRQVPSPEQAGKLVSSFRVVPAASLTASQPTFMEASSGGIGVPPSAPPTGATATGAPSRPQGATGPGSTSPTGPSVQPKLPHASLQKLSLAHSIADWSGDNVALVKTLANTTGITSLRDVARNYGTDKLATVIDPAQVPADTPGSTPAEKVKNYAVSLQHGLFRAEPTAVLQRMVRDAEVPIPDADIRSGVTALLTNLPDFNIRTTSVYTAFQQVNAFNGVPLEQRAAVAEQLKILQRVQAISPVPEAVPVLMNANLTSAFRIAQIPESTFLKAYGPTLGETTTMQVYTASINSHIRNEHALMTIRESMRGTGLAIIDGEATLAERVQRLQAVADKHGVSLNLGTLFGSIDYCECDDCLSVYSPAAYFVDLLQYLRNNDLDPKNPHTAQKGIAGTPLEKLFRRRPDLGCLELTCENTFTVLPYIDLANEVMESFIVHLDKYHTDANDPKQATLDVFNATDETSSELLAQPQHVNYQAYCILKNTVYPFTLPYHQPIDAIRIWLKYFGTSRWELLDIFRTATETCDSITLTPVQLDQLKHLHGMVFDRAVDAEFLGITQEEYIILTTEAFWPKAYFELTLQKTFSDDEYRHKIGVRAVHEYYGYADEATMLSTDESQQLGLTFVKKQFLPRTGIQYGDLVALLKTRYINPVYPQGEALTIMDSLRFSYRFLQTLVDTTSADPKVRFAKLIAFLNAVQPLVPMIDAYLHPDPCHRQRPDPCAATDFTNWVYCYFDRIGKLIVLESGEGPELPIAGDLFSAATIYTLHIGTLHRDGTITDPAGKLLGKVDPSGKVIPSDAAFAAEIKVGVIIEDNKKEIGFIDKDGFIVSNGTEAPEGRVGWLPPRDTCNLDKVRLVHLDGTSTTAVEYDRMQRFIRLWRKFGGGASPAGCTPVTTTEWTMNDTDLALIGLSTAPPSAGCTGTVYCGFTGFDTTAIAGGDAGGECCSDGAGNLPCPDIPTAAEDISTDFLHQLVAVRRLLDLTGLALDKLLALWANISIAGEKSLYSRLFLTHNVLGIDKVFQSDRNGNYLTAAAKMSDHMPVLLAALKLKAADMAAVIAFRSLPDALTLANVSALFRHAVLARLLHVPVSYLPEVIGVFGDAFLSASSTLSLLTDWGSMEDAGFTFGQLDYIVRGHDDPRRPIAPSPKTILVLAKTLYDGLNAIDQTNPDLTADQKDQATDDFVRLKVGLIFDASTVDGIVGLLDGTTVHTTNAPIGLMITVPASLSTKLKYSDAKGATPSAATIQVIGILTDAELTSAKALSPDPNWSKALDRVGKQALHFFNDVLFGIFPDTGDAVKNLLAGDVNVAPDPTNPHATDADTAPAKRFYFLHGFLPFLRKRLAHKLIVDTLSTAVKLASDVTDVFLSEVLVAGTSKDSALNVLEKIQQQPAGTGPGWSGDLIPPMNDSYTFIVVSDTQPAPLLLNGAAVPFLYQQDDPSNVWWTDSVKLKAGTLYTLTTSVAPLQWKTAISPRAAIPASALLPDYTTQGAKEALIKLFKAALVANGFNLSADEVRYLQSHGADFDGLDFNIVTLQHWRRLHAYAVLRDGLPKLDLTMLDLFKWTTEPDDPSKLSWWIASVTGWGIDDISRLIAPAHFDLNRPEEFRNEVNLVRLKKALAIAVKIGAGVDVMFSWASPASNFWVCHDIAQQIQAALRARYDQEDWEQLVKPLYDQLRQDQQQALVAYLLVQQDLIEWGVVDADSLFEFFLIDVEMCACMETSRIKQAISSVQSFVQRCLLGLEAQYGVGPEVLDRERWSWMQKYRVWEANRKVFLYPENWIKSELRDDKSPFYKELESELLQKDINPQTIADAVKNYLFKVDEVADLKVVGLFFDGDRAKLHVFARTRNAPYLFFYRYFNIEEKNWYPWEKVQVDIPSYDSEVARTGVIVENGTYLVPVVWNQRPLIFFPQFVKKRTTPSGGVDVKQDSSGLHYSPPPPAEQWEIKMGWSEYRNGKWTQKQMSTEAVYQDLQPIYLYKFVPRLYDSGVAIDIYYDFGQPLAIGAVGRFFFAGSQISLRNKGDVPAFGIMDATDFHYNEARKTISSLQAAGDGDPDSFEGSPSFDVDVTGTIADLSFASITPSQVAFYHEFAHNLLETVAGGKLDDLFDYFLNTITDPADKANAWGHVATAANGVDQSYHELKRPYSLYNWEAAFHATMQLVDRMLAAQQFDQALAMCHKVLNPFAAGTDSKRFWQFQPFREVDTAESSLEYLFLNLQPNKPDEHITAWRNNPFQPHLVARDRPSSYMKWVAMKYIGIWIAYGDYYFRQNTLETLPLAIQCYVMASHVYGPAGQTIPKRGKILPQTYNSLIDRWDAFSNAMVELELVFPFSNQTPLPIPSSNGVVGLANVFGFATTLYFGIPDNPQLRALRATIDDRLFKIRHCEDIDGVFRKLPLFEPPIDPGLLVQAAAQGLSLSSVLNDLNSPMPNYRFYYFLQKALELCGELKALGGAFLAAKEKLDAEALAQLRATHETTVQNLVMEVKKQQLEESSRTLDALNQNRKAPVYRLQHYLNLIGEDLGRVPDGSTDFREVADTIEAPSDESGLKLIAFEKDELDKAHAAADWQRGIGILETLAGGFHALPTMSADGHPLGVGVDAVWGFANLANALQATARGLKVHADDLTYQSSTAGKKTGFLRQLQDRVREANAAGYEIKNIDKQTLTQQIRINIAQQEITNQQKQIDNAREVEDFLRNKYTNQELYSWMEGEVRALYYQTYTLAYDLGKKAEKLFRFERGLSTTSFIQYGYWDPARDGLLAGERLYNGLKQLEAAYLEKRGHDFEITKSISLRQLNPLALVQLRETGSCEFTLPEILFDMDYPGHYMRRIKSVALRIPCTVGSHTSIGCTLRLLEHKFRLSPLAKDKNDYPEKTDEADDRFATVNVPIIAIAVSSIEEESGVFDLNFRDDRYLPFEGAGVISKWRIELPEKFRQWDYDTMNEPVIRLLYTSLVADKLKQPASDCVLDYIKSVEDLSRDQGLFAAFDVKNDFSDAWYTANHPAPGASERTLTIDKLNDKLPVFTKGRPPSKIRANDIYLYVSGSLSATAFTAHQDGNDIPFTDGPPLEPASTMKCFMAKDVDAAMDAVEIKIADTKTTIDKMWLIERYVLL
jgi:hypothetical protein